MYDPKSLKAEEFIDHEEILASLAYADEHKDDLALIDEILEKAKAAEGLEPQGGIRASCLSHRRTKIRRSMPWQSRSRKIFTATVSSCLRRCTFPTIASTAALYCPVSCRKTSTSPAKKLTQEEIRAGGHRPAGSWATSVWPWRPARIRSTIPLNTCWNAIQTIYGINHKNGAIRRVNVNIAATTVENYRKLKGCRHRHLHPFPGDLPQGKLMSNCIPRDRSMTTITTPRPWTGPWRAASMM